MIEIESVFQELDSACGRTSFDIIYDAPLSRISSFKIGGIAKYVVYPKSESALIELIKLLDEAGLPYIIVGKSSNILYTDRTHEEVIISTVKLDNYKIDNNKLFCQTGAALTPVANALLKHELSGFEGLAGIPGSIGGAIYMNAGAYGYEIADRLFSVRCFDKRIRQIIELPKGSLDLKYRSSIFKTYSNLVILSATFIFESKPSEEIKGQMDLFRNKRRASQPLEFPSAGSVFKRPENNSAGALIDQAGLKGLSVGDASVSEKHAGFIINKGSATAENVIELIRIIEENVLDKFGISLECEIEII